MEGCEVPKDLRPAAHQELFLAPQTAGVDHSSWLQSIADWRMTCRQQIGYNGSIYLEDRLQWTRKAFV